MASNRKRARENPELYNSYSVAYAHRHPERHMLSVAKSRAKKYGIEFSITAEDIVIPERCPVFGFPLISGMGRSGRPGGNVNSPSLDRIDASIGYVPGNVQVISHLANSMKHKATNEQLRQFAKWVLGVDQ